MSTAERQRLTVARVGALRVLLAAGLTRAAIARAAYEPWGFASAASLAEVVRRQQLRGHLPSSPRADCIPEIGRTAAARIIDAAR